MSEFLFSFVDSNKNNIFAVDNTTGVITVNGTLDREKTSSYLLRIGVSIVWGDKTHFKPELL